ncbi:MAG: hypothetical protein IKL10_04645 [Clostridia bacterium]|nr:hypothetical protein [Clostridia bacterium]
MENLIFEKGEVRKFEYSVRTSPSTDTLVVTSATWKLLGCKGEVISSGVCDISGTNISMLVSLQKTGTFTLEVTAIVPPETIIDRTLLRVVE